MFGEFAKFWRNDNGGIGPIFAIVSSTLFLSAAVATDTARWGVATNQLQQAVDAAALAGAAHLQRNPNDAGGAIDAANASYKSNYDQHAFGSDVDVSTNFTVNGTTVRGAASGKIRTVFAKILLVNQLALNLRSEATATPPDPFELSIVIEAGSQSPLTFANTKSVATKLVNTMLESNPGGQNRAAVVPYSNAVAADYQTMLAAVGGEKNVPTGLDGGGLHCVMDRNIDWDAPPGYNGIFSKPNNVCFGLDGPSSSQKNPLVSLTSDRGALTARVGNLMRGAGTWEALDVGLEWGWYTLSPNWNFPGSKTPVAYGGKTRKILVLVSTGLMSRWLSLGDGSAKGSKSDENLPRFLNMCRNMKEKGVEVFTIRMPSGNDFFESNIDDPRAPQFADRMRKCASDEAHSFVYTQGEQLIQAVQSAVRPKRSVYLSK